MTSLTLPRALLDAETERTLAARMEAGVLAAEALAAGTPPAGATASELRALVAEGEDARGRFVEANLRLVAMVSRRAAARTGAGGADLFQEGCVGLAQAVMRFDAGRGCRFATYALFWIRAYVGAWSGAAGADRSPSRSGQARAARGVEGALAQTLGRAASAAEVAAALGRSEQWTAALLADRATRSLEECDALDRLAAPVDACPAEAAERTSMVTHLLARLVESQRTVLELRLGFATGSPLSYTLVADRLGWSSSRVRRTEQAALELLRGICPQSAAAWL